MSDEEQISLQFEFSGESEAQAAEKLIQKQLSSLSQVKEVATKRGKPRITGVEIVAGVAAALVVVKTSREVLKEVKKLLIEVKGLIKDLKGVKAVVTEVGGNTIDLLQTTPEQIDKLEEKKGRRRKGVTA